MGKVVSGNHIIVRRPHIKSQAALLLLNRHYATLCYYKRELARKAYLTQFTVLTCAYCGRSPLRIKSKDLEWLATIDHIIPRSKGGKDTWDNFCVACHPCNAAKKNRMLRPCQ